MHHLVQISRIEGPTYDKFSPIFDQRRPVRRASAVWRVPSRCVSRALARVKSSLFARRHGHLRYASLRCREASLRCREASRRCRETCAQGLGGVARPLQVRLEAVSGFGPRVSGLEFLISGLGSRVSDFGSRLSGLGCWVSGSGSRLSGLGFRADSLHLLSNTITLRSGDEW